MARSRRWEGRRDQMGRSRSENENMGGSFRFILSEDSESYGGGQFLVVQQ